MVTPAQIKQWSCLVTVQTQDHRMALTGCKDARPMQRGRTKLDIDVMKEPYMRCTGIIHLQGYVAQTPDGAKVWLRTLYNCSSLLTNTSLSMSYLHTCMKYWMVFAMACALLRVQHLPCQYHIPARTSQLGMWLHVPEYAHLVQQAQITCKTVRCLQ
jgi:hypothetical protein